MKIFIASDIHGSAYFCRQMLEAYEREQADFMVLLGDILYHGPRNDLPREYDTKAVSSMLNEYKDVIHCVCGNCDAPVDQWVLDFSITNEYLFLSDAGVDMKASVDRSTPVIFACHGHNYNRDKLPETSCIADLHQDSLPFDILLHGHTHVPACEICENYTYLNPGSVSIPKDNSWHGYMTYEKGVFWWKDFNGKEQMRYDLKLKI